MPEYYSRLTLASRLFLLMDALVSFLVAAVRGKTMSLRQAAKIYSIPSSTLQRRSAGKYIFPTELTAAEEKELAAWVIDISTKGFPLTRAELEDSVQLYLNIADRETKFKDNRPGHKWMNAFLELHPILTMEMAENTDKKRASATEGMIRSRFSKVCAKIII